MSLEHDPLVDDLLEIIDQEGNENAQEHIWANPYYSGMSGLDNDWLYSAVKTGHFTDLPEISGVRAEKGALFIGNVLHREIQRLLRKRFVQNYLQYASKGEIYIEEIYVVVPLVEDAEKLENYLRKKYKDLFPDNHEVNIPYYDIESLDTDDPWGNPALIQKKLHVEYTLMDFCADHPEILEQEKIAVAISPIDIAYCTEYAIRPLTFRGLTKMVPFPLSTTIFKRIYDIKTTSTFGFNETLKKGIEDAHYAQFIGYMKGAKLNKIGLLKVSKEKAKMFGMDAIYDDAIFKKACDKRSFAIQMSVEAKKHTTFASFYDVSVPPERLTWENFNCLNGGMSHWACPLVKAHDETDEEGVSHVVFDQLCPPAEALAKARVLKELETPKVYVFGRSHIIQIECGEDGMTLYNKGGTDYKLPYFQFWSKLKEYVPSPKKASKKTAKK
jgi:hypothetical protein